LSNEEVRLRFLASDEAAEETITEAEIEVDTFILEMTETEDLVTKFVAEWRYDYVADDPNKFIIRNNIPKYGEIEESYDFYIYNIKEFVRQSAFFWMVRYSNTWKIVRFNAFLDKLKLEGFDPVTLNFTAGLIADSAVKGSVTSVTYDSNNFQLQFEIWTSVRMGMMETYTFAFPASASVSEEYPTDDDPYAGGAA
jgi:hypothetical protein